MPCRADLLPPPNMNIASPKPAPKPRQPELAIPAVQPSQKDAAGAAVLATQAAARRPATGAAGTGTVAAAGTETDGDDSEPYLITPDGATGCEPRSVSGVDSVYTQ